MKIQDWMRFGLRQKQLSIEQDEANVTMIENERSTATIFHTCKEISLETVQNKASRDNSESIKHDVGLLVRESIRDYADMVLSDFKQWKHVSKVFGFIQNKCWKKSEFICRKNLTRAGDSFLDQFGFCHPSCSDESEF